MRHVLPLVLPCHHSEIMINEKINVGPAIQVRVYIDNISPIDINTVQYTPVSIWQCLNLTMAHHNLVISGLQGGTKSGGCKWNMNESCLLEHSRHAQGQSHCIHMICPHSHTNLGDLILWPIFQSYNFPHNPDDPKPSRAHRPHLRCCQVSQKPLPHNLDAKTHLKRLESWRVEMALFWCHLRSSQTGSASNPHLYTRLNWQRTIHAPQSSNGKHVTPYALSVKAKGQQSIVQGSSLTTMLCRSHKENTPTYANSESLPFLLKESMMTSCHSRLCIDLASLS